MSIELHPWLHPRDGGDGLPGLGGGVGDGVGAPLLVPLVHAVELQLELLVRYLEKQKKISILGTIPQLEIRRGRLKS